MKLSFLRRLKNGLLYKVYLQVKKCIIASFRYLPICSKKVVFDNFGGRGYGDDPKYIAEHLRQSGKGLKLIWVTQDMQTPLPEGIRPVKYGTIRAAFHWATAKVWVDNIKSSFKVKKKKGQFYIQTWHSTLGFKKNEGQVNNLPEEYVKRAKQDAAVTDLMYSNNDVRKRIYETFYWYDGPVMKCSVPRNTVLFHVTEELREKVYDYFGIPQAKKVLLYAPTFRKSGNLEIYRMEYEQVLKAAEDKWGGEFVLLLRLHPNDAKQSDFIVYNNRVLNASHYPDMQELLAVAEVLITDYSGCMFDFSFLKKPVFLYVPDLKEYLQKERELQFSFEEVPFQKAGNFVELLECIKEFAPESYQKECDSFFDTIGLCEDGSGAKIIGDIIIQKCM